MNPADIVFHVRRTNSSACHTNNTINGLIFEPHMCMLFISLVPSTAQVTLNATQTQLKRTSLTWQWQKTEFTRAIMLAITQLYSLCAYHYQNLIFNQAERERRAGGGDCGAAVGDGVRVNLPNKCRRGRALRCRWGRPPTQIMRRN